MRGRAQEYPSYPEIEDALSYNPARFLDSTIERTDCTRDLTVTALIRGIDDIETIRAWIEVEVDLGRADDGPRREIIKWLNHRQAQIESNDAAAPSTAAESDVATTSTTTEESTSADAERASDDEPTEPTPAGETTPDTAATVATDGGAPSSPPICPNCRGELTREEIGDETAHWCPFCGGFCEPIGGTA